MGDERKLFLLWISIVAVGGCLGTAIIIIISNADASDAAADAVCVGVGMYIISSTPHRHEDSA